MSHPKDKPGPAPPANPAEPDRLSPRQEAYLKVAKEIAVKYVETGRISTAAFQEAFEQIYRAVAETVDRDRR